jgi:transmembrane sensor
MDSHQDIEDQAAAFLARRDSGVWSQADQAQLEQWLAQSVARRVGFLRLESAWDETRRLKALSAGLAPGAVPSPGEWRHTPFFESQSTRLPQEAGTTSPSSIPPVPTASTQKYLPSRRRVRFLAVAATVLLAIGMLAYFTWNPSDDRYSTPIGGMASVPLADGSHITLNTATRVRVELTPKERHVRLDDGEAFFEVAHDATRPFIVQAGNKRVVAVGTKFSVRRNGEDIRVVVTEGKVRVESGKVRVESGLAAAGRAAKLAPASDAQTAADEVSREGGAGEVFLIAGSIASASDAGVVVEQEPLIDAEDDLTWRQGYLTFHDTSLADAVAEFNRYNTHKIAIDDPAVAAIRISGSFRALNYEAFVRVLGDGFAIHARDTNGATTLTR